MRAWFGWALGVILVALGGSMAATYAQPIPMFRDRVFGCAHASEIVMKDSKILPFWRMHGEGGVGPFVLTFTPSKIVFRLGHNPPPNLEYLTPAQFRQHEAVFAMIAAQAHARRQVRMDVVRVPYRDPVVTDVLAIYTSPKAVVCP